MKKTIEALKFHLDFSSDKALAGFLGVTENTVTRAKAGHKTKLHAVLPMLEWWLENATKKQHEAFAESFRG